MNRETFINDDKTILNTDFYLYLLQKEIDAKKYKEVIDKIEKIRHDRTCAENQIDEIEEVLKEVI